MGKKRIVGLDIARCFAILGMMFVNYKEAIGANDGSFLAGLNSLLEGRAAALFLILAGVGISIMSQTAVQSKDPIRIKKVRITLIKRATFLGLLGLVLYAIGWTADILHYYCVYMIIAAFLIDLDDNSLWGLGILTLLFSSLFQLVFDYTANWSADFSYYIGFWTPHGFIRNLFLNGYHPVFPWICFIILGLLLGRLDLKNKELRKQLTFWALGTAVVIEATSKILIYRFEKTINLEIAQFLFDTKPMAPTGWYVIAASATAVAAIMLFIRIGEIWQSVKLKRSLIMTGQMALTHYVLHVLGIGILEETGLIDVPSPWVSTLFSLSMFVFFLVFSYAWSYKFNRGPLELVMRKIA